MTGKTLVHQRLAGTMIPFVTTEICAAPTDPAEASGSDPALLEFIASLADSLAWPVAIIVLILAFRRDVRKLFEKIVSISIRGNTISFDQTLQAAKEQAKHAGLPLETDSSRAELKSDRESSGDYPRAAIIEAWLTVLQQTADACLRLGLVSSPRELRRRIDTISLLRKAGHVNEDLDAVLRHLRHLRNEAAHDMQFDISPAQATDYLVLCEEVAAYLGQLGRSR